MPVCIRIINPRVDYLVGSSLPNIYGLRLPRPHVRGHETRNLTIDTPRPHLSTDVPVLALPYPTDDA